METEKIIDVSRRHPIWKTMYWTWCFWMDSYKGGRDYVKSLLNIDLDRDGLSVLGSYLDPHDLELNDPVFVKFKRRHARSFYDNWCALPVNTYAKYLFNNQFPIIRYYDPNSGYQSYIDDITLKGDSIDGYMKRLTTNALILGIGYTLIDKQPIPSNVRTLYDQKQLGTRAYANYIDPISLVDWSSNPGTGQYEWVLIQSKFYRTENWDKPNKLVTVYFLWTKQEVYILDENGNKLLTCPCTGMEFEENPIQHGLGIVPLLPLCYTDADKDGINESMLSTIADINRNIYNIDSEYDENRKLAFAQLMMQSSEDEWEEPGKTTETIVSVDRVIKYPAGSNPPTYLAFPPDAMVEKRARKNELIQDILRLSGLGNQSGVSGDYTSGLAMSFAYSDIYTNVAQLAQRLEVYEKQIWNIIKLYEGALLTGDIDVQYPDRFDVKTDQERRDNYIVAKQQLTKSPTALLTADMDWGMSVYRWDEPEKIKIQKELEEGYQGEVGQDRLLMENLKAFSGGEKEEIVENEKIETATVEKPEEIEQPKKEMIKNI